MGWKIFVVVATIAGFIGFIMIFHPSISVSPAPSLDTENPLLTPFIVSNDNDYLSIYNVQYRVNFQGEAAPPKGRGAFSLALDNSDHIISRIGPKEPFTISLPVQYSQGAIVEFADISILVEFEAFKYIPIKQSRTFHFNTAKKSDGSLNWYRQTFTNKTSTLPRLNFFKAPN